MKKVICLMDLQWEKFDLPSICSFWKADDDSGQILQGFLFSSEFTLKSVGNNRNRSIGGHSVRANLVLSRQLEFLTE